MRERQHPASAGLWDEALSAWQDGCVDDALRCLERLVDAEPEHADGHHLIGVIRNDAGDFSAAIAALERASVLAAGNDQVFSNLGYALLGEARLDAAEAALRRALALNPGNPFAAFNLGCVLADAGRQGEAEAAFRRAAELDPADPDVWMRLGHLAYGRDDYAGAAEAFGRATVPDSPIRTEALRMRGFACADAGRPASAIAAFEELARIDGGAHCDLQLLSQWLYCHLELCDWRNFDNLVAACRERLAGGEVPLEPFTFLLVPGVSGAQQRALTAAFVAPMLAVDTLPPVSTGERERLRIAYLSADFHEHATAYLLAGVLEHHDREHFEIHAFSYGPADEGPMRQRLRAACDVFDEVADLDLDALARRIRAAGIDILIDLKGWTGNSRSAVLARRPAPVQVNWLGYPGSLGSAALADYLIGDAIVTPPERAAEFAECLALMPHCYQPNDRQRAMAPPPTRAAAGLPEAARVLCCFNRHLKINPEVFDVWCAILRAVPEAILWLLDGDPQARANLRREAAAREVAPERLIFAPLLPQAEHLGRLALADLAIDTWPCGAHTTASDALWAGVPFVTWPGDGFQSRVAASLVHAAGLGDAVAANADAYRDLCIALLTDAGRLTALRRRLSGTRLASPLFDSERFARDLEALLRRMWERRGLPEKSLITVAA